MQAVSCLYKAMYINNLPHYCLGISPGIIWPYCISESKWSSYWAEESMHEWAIIQVDIYISIVLINYACVRYTGPLTLVSQKRSLRTESQALFWFPSENETLFPFPPEYLRSAGFAGRKWGCAEIIGETDSISQIHSLATSMQVFRLPDQKLWFFLNKDLRV